MGFFLIPALLTEVDTDQITDGAVTRPKLSFTQALDLIEKKTVSGGAVTDLTFSSLDGDTDGVYLVVGTISNATGSSGRIHLFINGDTTDGNYTTQRFKAENVTLSTSRENDARLGGLQANDDIFFLAWVQRTAQDFGKVISNCINDQGTSTFREEGYIATDSTISNITSITLHSTVASAIDNDSTVSLYKLGGT